MKTIKRSNEMENEELIFVIGDEEVNKYPGNDIEWKYAKCLQLRTIGIKKSIFKIQDVYDVPGGKAFKIFVEPNCEE